MLADAGGPHMQIGYFTNQYPSPSHTFIRREIAALEQRGHSVCRFAIRRSKAGIIDPDDIAELARTRHVVGQPGWEVIRCCTRVMIDSPGACLRGLFQTLQLAQRAGYAYGRHLAYLIEAMVLVSWCRASHIEHLHVHFGTNPATVALLTHGINGVPFSVTIHGPEEFDRPEALALAEKISAAAFVVAISAFGRSQLLRWAHLTDWKKIRVISCGLDRDYLDAPSAPALTAARLVTVGRLCEQKGHLILLEAAAKLHRRGLAFTLVFAGDGPLRPAIEQRVAELGLTGLVEVLGAVTQEEVRHELLKARALVLPSLAEGLPIVLMESMALARPVISTFVAGIPELVTRDVGWLVPAGDVDALCDVMQEVLELDRATLSAMGEAARRRVRERHDIDRAARLLEQCFVMAAAEASVGAIQDGDRTRSRPNRRPMLWKTKSLRR